MAFLMLLHEKMRLKRKVNKLTLKQAQNASRLDRVQKNIERVQKMYSKRESSLEKTTQIVGNRFKQSIWNQAGLGTQNQSFNPYSGGLTTFVQNAMTGMLKQNGGISDINLLQGIMMAKSNGTLKAVYKQDSNGKDTNEIDHYTDNTNATYSVDDINKVQYAYQMANNQQSMAQAYCNEASSQYENNLSIWIERQKQLIEDEQQEALAPLESLQTEYDLEKASIETQLTTAREYLQNLESALGESIKDSAPKFGLG